MRRSSLYATLALVGLALAPPMAQERIDLRHFSPYQHPTKPRKTGKAEKKSMRKARQRSQRQQRG